MKIIEVMLTVGLLAAGLGGVVEAQAPAKPPPPPPGEKVPPPEDAEPPPAPEPEATVAAGWDIADERSPVDGRRTYSALLPSANVVTNTFGREDRAYLGVSCVGRNLSVYVAMPTYVGYEQTIVQYRFDGSALRNEWWPTGSRGTSTGRFDNRRAGYLLRRLAPAKEFGIRVFVADGARDVIFTLDGIDAVAAQAREACP